MQPSVDSPMDDFAPLRPGSTAFTHALRQRARHEFRSFYATACPADAVLMDTLLIMHAAFEEALMTPRTRLSWTVRVAFEKMCNEAEQTFMDAREKVHHCPTFQRLSLSQQTRIVVLVFDVRLHVAG